MAKKNEKIKINPEVKELHELPKEVVVIPIVNSPIFPGMIAPIILSEDKYTKELDAMVSKVGYVALNLVKFKEGQEYVLDSEEEEEQRRENDIEEYEMEAFDDNGDELTAKDVYRVGVYCKIVKKLKLPDGSVNLLVHGLKRYSADKFLQESPLLVVKANIFEDNEYDINFWEFFNINSCRMHSFWA